MAKLRSYLPIIIALAGFIFHCSALYPGFVSPDSLDQYNQAITHNYHNWHPPMMAAWWAVLNVFGGGQAPMFIFQLILFWSSFVLLSYVLRKYSPRLIILLIAMLFAPFIQNFVGNIWKDMQMAVCWLMATSLMLQAHIEKRHQSFFEKFFTLLLLFYGSWVRMDSLPGLLPLVFYWCYVNFPGQRTFRGMAVSVLLVMATSVIFRLMITSMILKPSETHITRKLYLHDLAGIYAKTGKYYIPDFLTKQQGFDSAYLRKNYLYETNDNIWWNNDGVYIAADVNDEQLKILRNAWLKGITGHPGTYLSNRMKGYLRFLRVVDSGSDLIIFYPYVHENKLGLSFTPNRLTEQYSTWIVSKYNAVYMRPWFWLLCAIVLLALTFVRSNKLSVLVRCLCCSSLFYFALASLVFPVDTEFRYFYWNCICTSLAFVISLPCWLNRLFPAPLRENNHV